MSIKKILNRDLPYSPEELEYALKLRYILYLENLPNNENGKPWGTDVIRHEREDCEASPRLALKYVQDYRDAKANGLHLEDPLGLIENMLRGRQGFVETSDDRMPWPKGRLAMTLMKHLGGVINRYQLSQADLKIIEDKANRWYGVEPSDQSEARDGNAFAR